MKFRRIYWVSEQFNEEGFSEVTGVFTSVPDLIETGLGVTDRSKHKAGFRITLCALDSRGPSLLTLTSTDFSDCEEKIAPYVQSGEITEDEAARLKHALS